MRLFVFTCIACWWLSTSLLAQAGSDAAAVLKQMRLASGGAALDRVAEIVEHGQMMENGFTGQLTLGEDLKTGSYAFKAEFPTANVRIGQGVHRDDIWTLNQQGDLAVHSGAHDDNDAVTDAYLYRRGYWRPGFDGAAVHVDSPVIENGVFFDRVRITPADGESVVLWINASTHLLDREQWGDAAKRYGDYRVVNGLKLPFSIRHVTNEHEDYAITLERIDVKEKVEDADLAIGFYRDFEMPASGVVTVPTEHGTTFDVRINGKGPFKMFFDTGSINIIGASIAKEVGIVPQGGAEKLNGTVDVRPATVKTLQIGDVTMHDQPFVVMDIPGEFAVVGYEFLQRFVVKIDYEHNRMTMYDLARFSYIGGGVAVPMLVKSRGLLYVKGSVDGFKGQFALDTGNEFGLEFEPGFVRINDLVGWTHARFHGYAGRGYAGPAPESYYAHIHKLTIGAAEVDDIAANLSQGDPHDGEPDANLGQSVFRQFNCTFDEIRGKLYLEKNGNWGPVPFNRAGIVVNPQDDGMKVMTVLPGSPGEGVGLQVGDLITKIDGKALDGTQDESAFARPVGTFLRLTVKRGQVTQEIAVTLKDVL
ncbi:MAG: retroviral-like aspartic protease family protein [Silvibacterium sp.]